VLRGAGLVVVTMIEAAHDRDLPDVRRLLELSHLPLEGVATDGALLRSVAVDPARQGRRLGHQLTEAALRLAQLHGADTVFLLTTTAERFFPRFGFEPIARDEVPASVQASVEFQSACPESAIVMRKRLEKR
jgi:amino-acid N-acetyltransferase